MAETAGGEQSDSENWIWDYFWAAIAYAKEFVDIKVLFGAACMVASFCYTRYAEWTTKPYARRTVYFDSEEAFPNASFAPLLPLNDASGPPKPSSIPSENNLVCGPVTHIRYEVENRGLGDIDDVRIIVRLTPEEAKLISADRVFTGHVWKSENGRTSELVVTTLDKSASASPLKSGERFGVELSIPIAKWMPDTGDVVLRQGSSEEVPILDEELPPPDRSPYWIATLFGMVVFVFALMAAHFRWQVKRKAARDLANWIAENQASISRDAAEKAAEVLSKSEDVKTDVKKLKTILQESRDRGEMD